METHFDYAVCKFGKLLLLCFRFKRFSMHFHINVNWKEANGFGLYHWRDQNIDNRTSVAPFFVCVSFVILELEWFLPGSLAAWLQLNNNWASQIWFERQVNEIYMEIKEIDESQLKSQVDAWQRNDNFPFHCGKLRLEWMRWGIARRFFNIWRLHKLLHWSTNTITQSQAFDGFNYLSNRNKCWLIWTDKVAYHLWRNYLDT